MAESIHEERFRLWLRGLPAGRLRALASEFSQNAFNAGLKVLKPSGETVAIPPALTAVVESDAALAERSATARALLSGLVKTAAYFLGGAGEAEAPSVFHGLSPWEWELLRHTWRQAGTVATARADLFTGADGVDYPLEMNTTIPAMQGYADIAAQAFVLMVARAAGITREEAASLARDSSTNGEDLRLSLLAHLERLGVSATRPSVAVVARSQDSQSSELAYLCAYFNAHGLVAYRCTPEQLALERRGDGKDRATLLGEPVDLIYRHIFARRIEPQSDLGRMMLEPQRFHILNPANSQLEVKALLAELSRSVHEPSLATAIGLDEVELVAARRVPWNRRLVHRPDRDFAGEPLSDLVDFAKAKQQELVLKRSWGYGGSSVLLGDELDSSGGQSRAREISGLSDRVAIRWGELLDRCVETGDCVVQRRVEPVPREHLVVGPDGPSWTEWYVDVSAFTNLGVEPHPHGGVRRGSRSRIVNILGGGGLVPAIREVVMTRLLAASASEPGTILFPGP
jgi:hypothetical protein